MTARAEGSRARVRSAQTSTRGNRLPAGMALGHIRVVACRIGTITPSLRRVGVGCNRNTHSPDNNTTRDIRPQVLRFVGDADRLPKAAQVFAAWCVGADM